ncbi:MAG: Hsp20 family protein, partial [Sphingomonadales bacterium]
EMTLEGELLKVEGKAEPTKDEGVREFFFKGIAKRAFTRQFQLADNIRVSGAGFKDGLLAIDLFREVPEHEKPRRIAIKTAGKRKAIEGKKAA